MKRLIILAVLLQSCTVAKVTTPGGMAMTYVDVHFGGNKVQAEAVAEGIGALSINRNTEDSTDTILGAAQLLRDALTPVVP